MRRATHRGWPVLALLGLLLFLDACDLVEKTEVARIVSPDGRVEAVLVKVEAGATVATSFKVYIVPKGGKASHPNPDFLADHVEGLDLKWQAPRLLVIRYDKARIFRFSNFWHSREVDDFRYEVEIRLAPGQPRSLTGGWRATQGTNP